VDTEGARQRQFTIRLMPCRRCATWRLIRRPTGNLPSFRDAVADHDTDSEHNRPWAIGLDAQPRERINGGSRHLRVTTRRTLASSVSPCVPLYEKGCFCKAQRGGPALPADGRPSTILLSALGNKQRLSALVQVGVRTSPVAANCGALSARSRGHNAVHRDEGWGESQAASSRSVD